MSFSQLVSELGPPPEKVKSKKKKKKKKAFRFWVPPPANSWTRACYYTPSVFTHTCTLQIRIYMYTCITLIFIFPSPSSSLVLQIRCRTPPYSHLRDPLLYTAYHLYSSGMTAIQIYSFNIAEYTYLVTTFHLHPFFISLTYF